MKNKVITILIICITFFCCTPAFAVEIDSNCNPSVILTDKGTRGTGYPNSTWDLEKSAYVGTFDFGSTIYSNCYFHPNDNGELSIQMVATSTNDLSGTISVSCLEKTLIGFKTIDSVDSDTSKEPTISHTFENLDPNKKYFLEFAILRNIGGYNFVGNFSVYH